MFQEIFIDIFDNGVMGAMLGFLLWAIVSFVAGLILWGIIYLVDPSFLPIHEVEGEVISLSVEEEKQPGPQPREVLRIEASGEVIFAEDMTLSEAKAVILQLIQRYVKDDICGRR